MDELNLYQGEHTGRVIDRCIQRVQITPRNGAIPFIWKDSFSITGTAGSSYFSSGMNRQEPSGIPYHYWPHSGSMLSVEIDHPEYLDFLSVGWSRSYRANFRESGTVNITLFFVEYPEEVEI